MAMIIPLAALFPPPPPPRGGEDDEEGEGESGTESESGSESENDDESAEAGGERRRRRGRSPPPRRRKGKKGAPGAPESEEDFSDYAPVPKRMKKEERDIITRYSREERAYYRGMPQDYKVRLLDRERELRERKDANHALEPMRFRILNSDMDPSTKALVLVKLDQFQNMWEGAGEYFKLKAWLQAVCRLPLGTYHRIPIQPSDPTEKVAGYLQGVRQSLDATVYGHTDTKNQMMRIIAQWVSNPDSRGQVIGISGPPGVGKTVMVKEGICKALGLPFGFMALGGASDGSFLDGHGFTYEGSTYGKIAEVLMKTRCMNPILMFDELDKVSQTRRGDEIYNILVHLTDVSQNERFQDRYFGEIEMDLSRALMVFSYNDETLINPILKDRMITISVKGYSKKEKLEIAQGYLLPDILRQYRLAPTDIVFGPDILDTIIERVPEEEGVRNLKRGIESIVSWLNMHRYIPPPAPAPSGPGAPRSRPKSAPAAPATPSALTPPSPDDPSASVPAPALAPPPPPPAPITFPVTVTEQHVRDYLPRREDPRMNFMKSLYT